MKLMRRNQRSAHPVLAVVLASLMVVLAGCGSSTKNNDAGDSSAGEGVTQLAQDRLEMAYNGLFSEPQTDTPSPTPGKKVWVVVYDQSASFSQQHAEGARDAAKLLGWDVNIFDAKGDPNSALQGIRNAIAAKAEGIVLQFFDCNSIKSGVEQALAAGIKVVADQSVPCSPDIYSAATVYLTGGYPGNDGSFDGYFQAWNRPSADWIAVKSGGKAKVIVVSQTDAQVTLTQTKGFVDELAEVCPGCEVVDTVKFTTPDLGQGLQQKIAQSLLQHPDATAIANTMGDYAQTGGIAGAALASGRSNKLLLPGGEGQPANIGMIRNNQGQQTATCQNNAWNAYTAIDQLIRLFEGAKPATTSGNGFDLVDAEHNMPASGKGCSPMKDGKVLDFAGLYKKVWGLS